MKSDDKPLGRGREMFNKVTQGESFSISGYEFPSDDEWKAIAERVMLGTATERDVVLWAWLKGPREN